MSGEHNHAHNVSATQVQSKAFVVGIVLNVLFVLIEATVGIITESLSLLTDAGHNLSDVSSLFISMLAFRLAKRKASDEFTYGYKKTTVLAAFINSVILLVALGVIGYEAVLRLVHPRPVEGDQIAWVAGVGIVINSVSAYLFFKNKESDLNVKSAYLHLLADALVSVGVVAAGIVIQYTDWFWLDPVVGLVIMVIILFSTWGLLKDSFKMSIDAVPEGISISEIEETAKKISGVKEMYHIHVWPLSTTENALTAHVVTDERLNFEEQKELVKKLKHELLHHNIHHSTIEVERQNHESLPAH